MKLCDRYTEEPDSSIAEPLEMYAELFYQDRPEFNLEHLFSAWEQWGYTCALSDTPRDCGYFIFKGGCAVIIGDASPVDHSEVPSHYAAFSEVARPLGDYCLNHTAAFDAFRASNFVVPVTIRVLTKNPFTVANELLISLDGLIEATGATCAWLDHLRCFVSANEFREFADYLRVDEHETRAIPTALFFTPHIYQLQPVLDSATRGLSHFGHPELALRGRFEMRPEQVARVLLNLGSYVLDGAHLEPGHSISVAQMNFRLQQAPPDEDSPPTLDLVPSTD